MIARTLKLEHPQPQEPPQKPSPPGIRGINNYRGGSTPPCSIQDEEPEIIKDVESGEHYVDMYEKLVKSVSIEAIYPPFGYYKVTKHNFHEYSWFLKEISTKFILEENNKIAQKNEIVHFCKYRGMICCYGDNLVFVERERDRITTMGRLRAMVESTQRSSYGPDTKLPLDCDNFLRRITNQHDSYPSIMSVSKTGSNVAVAFFTSKKAYELYIGIGATGFKTELRTNGRIIDIRNNFRNPNVIEETLSGEYIAKFYNWCCDFDASSKENVKNLELIRKAKELYNSAVPIKDLSSFDKYTVSVFIENYTCEYAIVPHIMLSLDVFTNRRVELTTRREDCHEDSHVADILCKEFD